MIYKLLIGTILFVILISSSYAQEGIDNSSNTTTNLFVHPLFWIEISLIVLVLVGAPIYATVRSNSTNSEILKGLNLPKGSVRAMLALLIVVSFINVLLFGTGILKENFEQVVTAFGTLAGAVTGFYFAGRQPTENVHKTKHDSEPSDAKDGAHD